MAQFTLYFLIFFQPPYVFQSEFTLLEIMKIWCKLQVIIHPLFYIYLGKTTLVAKLQAVEEPKKGNGLEYNYMEIR